MKQWEQLTAGEKDYINSKLTDWKVVSSFIPWLGQIWGKRWGLFRGQLGIFIGLRIFLTPSRLHGKSVPGLGMVVTWWIINIYLTLNNFTEETYKHDMPYFQKYLDEYTKLKGGDIVEEIKIKSDKYEKINTKPCAGKYNKLGFDQDGYNREGYNAYGFDRNGFNRDGYNDLGYDRNGFDRDGYNAYGFDRDGFKKDGYDRQGFDKDGFNRDGYDRTGYNKEGYKKDGYDKRGVDRDGYDRAGYDKDGYDKDGYDDEGYDKDGYNKNGINRFGEKKVIKKKVIKEKVNKLKKNNK